jgi:peroxiredoxin
MLVNLLILAAGLPWLMVVLLAALGCWISFQLVHQNGRLLARLEALEQRLAQPVLPAAPVPNPTPVPVPAPAPAPSGPPSLPLGSPAPDFELPDLNGGRRSLSDFRGKKLLLLFFNPRCGFCTRMAPDLAALPIDGAAGQPLPLVITTGGVEENRKLVEEHGIRCPVLLQEQMEVGSVYQCHGTPMGYLIDAQGKIASELAIGGPALLALTDGPSAPLAGSGHGPDANGSVPAAGALGGPRSVAESKIERDGLPAGSPAPALTLPLLHGGELSLEEYRGRKVLLVFSDPQCGPCDQLAPRLEQLHRRTPGIQVLMISRGEAEANRAKAAQHGLTFPILLQQQWEISRDYANFATPVAYLIDEEGIIAREVAIGVEPILALLSAPGPALAVPGNGKGRMPRHGKELARRR